jgi:parallel beta-helix repeat protein
MKIRRTLMVMLAVGALWCALAPSAEAANAVRVSCGETVTKDTKLANDLTNCPGIGIVVGADNITLDLNGHTIDGDGLADVEGVSTIGYNGVTIEGGRIRDFVEGVAVLFGSDIRVRELSLSNHRHAGVFVSDSSDVQVQRTTSVEIAFAGVFVTRSDHIEVGLNYVSRSGAGIAARLSDHLRITGNGASGNEGEGISIFDDTTRARIEGNLVSKNRSAGIVVVADDSLVSYNRVTKNGDNIVVAGSGNNVTQNDITDAVGFPDDPVGGFGILIDGGDANLLQGNDITGAASNGIRVIAFDPDGTGPAEDNVIRGNQVERAQLDGILVDETASDSLLERNLAVRAGDDGIDVESSTTSLIGNTANRNRDLGIEAVPGVIDGGGNEASGNGNPLQCTNVFCK